MSGRDPQLDDLGLPPALLEAPRFFRDSNYKKFNDI